MKFTSTAAGVAGAVTVAATDTYLAALFGLIGAISFIIYGYSHNEKVTFRASLFPIVFGTIAGFLVAMVGWEYLYNFIDSPNVSQTWVKCGIAFSVSFMSENVSRFLLDYKFKWVKE